MSEEPVIVLRGTEALLKVIDETVKLGVPPRQAVKWWLYILQAMKKRRAARISS